MVAARVVTETSLSDSEEFEPFTFNLFIKRSCNVLRLFIMGILGRLEGLESWSLVLSDCISVRISLPPSLTTFIRFIASGFSWGEGGVVEGRRGDGGGEGRKGGKREEGNEIREKKSGKGG